MIEIREIPSRATWDLRLRVLRPFSKSLEECAFPGDDAAGTFHLGAFWNNELAGIATFMPEVFPTVLSARHPYRLRGMATDFPHHRRGIGRALVQAGEEKLRSLDCELLWFNARVVAFPFYEALGYVYASDLFEIPLVGPHRVMFKHLRS